MHVAHTHRAVRAWRLLMAACYGSPAPELKATGHLWVHRRISRCTWSMGLFGLFILSWTTYLGLGEIILICWWTLRLAFRFSLSSPSSDKLPLAPVGQSSEGRWLKGRDCSFIAHHVGSSTETVQMGPLSGPQLSPTIVHRLIIIMWYVRTFPQE